MAETATTRAKFIVQSVNEQFYGPGPDGQKYCERVILSPAYSPDPNSENRAFWTATPNGFFEMYINNPEAWGKFVQGQEYYLDFTLAPQLVPA